MNQESRCNKSFSRTKGLKVYVAPARRHSSGFSVAQIIESDFCKRRRFKRSITDWKLPLPQELFKSNIWQHPQLMRQKEELNSIKNSLSSFNMKEWHQHTRSTNHAGEVISTIRKRINPELLTQAWCKFYEIVSSYELIPHEAIISSELNSIHLCEAPGAFITSLNHFIQLHYPTLKWKWRASTLNPYYEGNKLSLMINDDRFILQTLDFWEFGYDQTGDMFEVNNINRIISVAKSIHPIHLVTADGSIDCRLDPGEQESIVSPLHYYETLVALTTLSTGGSFLLKIFTMFESPTICLLYLLNCLFQTVELFKPVTSKEGNSEVYVICLNYAGPEFFQPYSYIFKENVMESNGSSMFFQEQLPSDFLCQISECSDFFSSVQLSVIKRNIDMFTKEQSSEDKNKLFQIRKTIAYSYLERYRLEPLSKHHFPIVGNEVIKLTPTLNFDTRDNEWCSVDKNCLDSCSFEDELNKLKSQLLFVNNSWPGASNPIIWFQSDLLYRLPELDVKLVYGYPVETVYSSKFCLGSLLNLWNEFHQMKPVSNHSVLHSHFNVHCLFEDMKELNGVNWNICDMRSFVYEGNVHKFELQSLEQILYTMKIIKTGDSLALIGLPLLTRVSVGIVYALLSCFEKVGFLNPKTCGYVALFINKKKYLNISSILENIVKTRHENNCLALHSFICVTQLVKDVNWYKCIIAINQIHLKNVASTLIEQLLSDPLSLKYQKNHHNVSTR